MYFSMKNWIIDIGKNCNYNALYSKEQNLQLNN